MGEIRPPGVRAPLNPIKRSVARPRQACYRLHLLYDKADESGVIVRRHNRNAATLAPEMPHPLLWPVAGDFDGAAALIDALYGGDVRYVKAMAEAFPAIDMGVRGYLEAKGVRVVAIVRRAAIGTMALGGAQVRVDAVAFATGSEGFQLVVESPGGAGEVVGTYDLAGNPLS